MATLSWLTQEEVRPSAIWTALFAFTETWPCLKFIPLSENGNPEKNHHGEPSFSTWNSHVVGHVQLRMCPILRPSSSKEWVYQRVSHVSCIYWKSVTAHKKKREVAENKPFPSASVWSHGYESTHFTAISIWFVFRDEDPEIHAVFKAFLRLPGTAKPRDPLKVHSGWRVMWKSHTLMASNLGRVEPELWLC